MTDTLIQVDRFLVLFITTGVMAELMVRLSLPTILGELLAGLLLLKLVLARRTPAVADHAT